jgi:hypothetical protein
MGICTEDAPVIRQIFCSCSILVKIVQEKKNCKKVDLFNSMATKFDSQKGKEAQEYVESVTGESFGSDFGGSLKDGVLLCKYYLLIQ